MKKEDVKVGMRVKVGDMSTEYKAYEFENNVNEEMLKFVGQEFTVSDVDDYGVGFDEYAGFFLFPWECLTPVEQPFSLANTKINVQKYADDNGISLEQAHKEIQPWLFEQGYNWGPNGATVDYTSVYHLYMGGNNRLTQTCDDYYFNYQSHNKEITLSRKVTVELTPSFVEAEEPAVEYVELGGKRYVKSELEEALSKIKAVEE